MKSTNRTKIIFSFAIVCAIGAGGIYAFFYTSMKNKTEATVGLSAQLNELSGQQARYLAAASALSDEKHNIEKLSAYFIRENDVVSFAKKIETLGPRSGTVVSIEALDPGVISGTSFLAFKISAEGKFENLEKLLVLLQNFPGKFEWKTVRLLKIAVATSDTVNGTTKVIAAKWKLEASLTALNFIK